MTSSFDADGALAAEAFSAAPQMPFASTGPLGAPSSIAAPAPEPPPEEPEPEAETLPEFDPRYRQPFQGLLYLGHLSREVVYMGHQFQLVTPSTAERLEIGLLTKEYEGTLSFEFSYAAALVAAYLVEIDGTPLPQPITHEVKDTALLSRWTWVKDTLKRPVIERLFQECMQLDDTVRSVLDAMGKA